jgi:hypothetical protein
LKPPMEAQLPKRYFDVNNIQTFVDGAIKQCPKWCLWNSCVVPRETRNSPLSINKPSLVTETRCL